MNKVWCKYSLWLKHAVIHGDCGFMIAVFFLFQKKMFVLSCIRETLKVKKKFSFNNTENEQCLKN